MRLSASSFGMIGGVAVEEVGGELDLVADRPAEQLAQPPAGRLAAGVEAGQLDAGVGARRCLRAARSAKRR